MTILPTERLTATARFIRVVLGIEYNLIQQVIVSENYVRVRSNSHSAKFCLSYKFYFGTKFFNPVSITGIYMQKLAFLKELRNYIRNRLNQEADNCPVPEI